MATNEDGWLERLCKKCGRQDHLDSYESVCYYCENPVAKVKGDVEDNVEDNVKGDVKDEAKDEVKDEAKDEVEAVTKSCVKCDRECFRGELVCYGCLYSLCSVVDCHNYRKRCLCKAKSFRFCHVHANIDDGEVCESCKWSVCRNVDCKKKSENHTCAVCGKYTKFCNQHKHLAGHQSCPLALTYTTHRCAWCSTNLLGKVGGESGWQKCDNKKCLTIKPFINNVNWEKFDKKEFQMSAIFCSSCVEQCLFKKKAKLECIMCLTSSKHGANLKMIRSYWLPFLVQHFTQAGGELKHFPMDIIKIIVDYLLHIDLPLGS